MKALFEHINQYSPLADTTWKDLEAALKKVDLAKGEFLIKEGKVCQHVYFLEKGCLRGFYDLDGKEITHWFAFENTFVTSFFSFISRKPSFENIQLMEDGTLWALTYEDLQQLYLTHADMERMGRIMHERYYVMLEERFVRNHFKEAKERYENLTLNSPHILQRVPLGYIASYLGITQETLSRIRAKS
ncbi:MAG TPA: Crp/Fnr family transcriptional regulator [Cyclobacteriaceae bacterium]|jgi:CRP-like cAMP-binding protein|nr:Crp/Fnr family transcriptional regulator [Cyclobacteriaceae bacterium]